jgi:hypothetical protein
LTRTKPNKNTTSGIRMNNYILQLWNENESDY